MCPAALVIDPATASSFDAPTRTSTIASPAS